MKQKLLLDMIKKLLR